MQSESANSAQNSENWPDVKGKIKAKYSKLPDDAINSVKGDIDQLSTKLQGKEYGYSKEQAEQEVKTFKQTIHSSDSNGMKSDSSSNMRSGSSDSSSNTDASDMQNESRDMKHESSNMKNDSQGRDTQSNQREI
jgi:uncharacterized protein YjbJ (UPF0337 family)